MKKILVFICILCLSVNISFAFDPYADEEPEKKSRSKLYWGIFMTLVGGFMAYDGFSQEEIDISKPSVDYAGNINMMWTHTFESNSSGSGEGEGSGSGEGEGEDSGEEMGWYNLYNGCGKSDVPDSVDNATNMIYNTGNVKLKDVVVKVRYKYGNGDIIHNEKDKVTLYHVKNGEKIEIDIDTWPMIPTYMEIEADSEEKVLEVLEKIEVDKFVIMKPTLNDIFIEKVGEK